MSAKCKRCGGVAQSYRDFHIEGGRVLALSCIMCGQYEEQLIPNVCKNHNTETGHKTYHKKCVVVECKNKVKPTNVAGYCSHCRSRQVNFNIGRYDVPPFLEMNGEIHNNPLFNNV